MLIQKQERQGLSSAVIAALLIPSLQLPIEKPKPFTSEGLSFFRQKLKNACSRATIGDGGDGLRDDVPEMPQMKQKRLE